MKTKEYNIENFVFAELTELEMNEIHGGIQPPRSRDKDVYDFEEE